MKINYRLVGFGLIAGSFLVDFIFMPLGAIMFIAGITLVRMTPPQ